MRERGGGGVVVFHNAVQMPTWPYFLPAYRGAQRCGLWREEKGKEERMEEQ